jgi:hypothetical protein
MLCVLRSYRLSVVDVYDGPKVKAALAELAGDLSHLSEDKEKASPCSETESDALCTPFVWWRSEGVPCLHCPFVLSLGIIVEHSPNDPDHIGRLSVVDVYDGPKVKAALAGSFQETTS